MSVGHATLPLREVLAEALPERPFRLELWDGSALPPTNGHGELTFRLRSPRVLGHVLRAPGQLGLGRAYVSGEIEVDDMDAALELLDGYSVPPLDARGKARLAAAAVRAGALRSVPRVPATELRPRGRRHSRDRDQRAVRHHYDVSNEFFAPPARRVDDVLVRDLLARSPDARGGPAHQARPRLHQARAAHRRTRARCRLWLGQLRPARRGASTACRSPPSRCLSPRPTLARERAAAAGLADRIEVRVADYRDLAGETFDAIASIGMVEHVGSVNIDAYARQLATVLRPGGRLLNHGIARLRHGDPEAGPFSERFVFPDAAPLHVSRVLTAIEAAGLEPTHVEGFRHDYARTLREWASNLDGQSDRAQALVGAERMRIWRLYLRAGRRGFETGFTSIFQIVAHRPN